MLRLTLSSILFFMALSAHASNGENCHHQLEQIAIPQTESINAEGDIVRREHDAQFNLISQDQLRKNQEEALFKDPLYLNNGFVAKEQSYAEYLIDKQERSIYFNAYEQARHKIHIKNGLVYNSENKLVDLNGIYIMDENLDIFILQEEFLNIARRGKQINHSHLARGKRITAAGQIKISKGLIAIADNKSGHYAPELSFLEQFRQVLDSHNTNLSKAQFDGYIQGPITLSSNGEMILQKLPNHISIDFSKKEIESLTKQRELNKIMKILTTPLDARSEAEEKHLQKVEKELLWQSMETLISYGIKFFN